MIRLYSQRLAAKEDSNSVKSSTSTSDLLSPLSLFQQTVSLQGVLKEKIESLRKSLAAGNTNGSEILLGVFDEWNRSCEELLKTLKKSVDSSNGSDSLAYTDSVHRNNVIKYFKGKVPLYLDNTIGEETLRIMSRQSQIIEKIDSFPGSSGDQSAIDGWLMETREIIQFGKRRNVQDNVPGVTDPRRYVTDLDSARKYEIVLRDDSFTISLAEKNIVNRLRSFGPGMSVGVDFDSEKPELCIQSEKAGTIMIYSGSRDVLQKIISEIGLKASEKNSSVFVMPVLPVKAVASQVVRDIARPIIAAPAESLPVAGPDY